MNLNRRLFNLAAAVAVFAPSLLRAQSAESADDLEAWARAFFAKVDRSDAAAIGADLTDDVHMVRGNGTPLVSRAAVEAAFRAGGTRFRALRHEITGVWRGKWSGGDVVSVEAVAHYTFPDGREVALPVTSTLRLVGRKVADYRIFMDGRPAFG
jgi:ketosteroid isomerase-like protein